MNPNFHCRLPVLILLVAFTCSLNTMRSQSIDREIMSPAGAHFSNPNGSITFTIGETMMQTFEQGMKLSQGFHQEWAFITAVGDNFEEPNQVSIYPNPTSGQLTVTSDGPARLAMFDLSGKAVFQYEKQAGAEEVDLGELPPGLFVLVLLDDQGRKGVYQVEVISGR